MGVGLQEEIQELRVKLQHLEKLVERDSKIASVSAGAPSPAGIFRFRTCVVLFLLIFLNVAGSAILGIYWAVRFDKMGDGFTAAGWTTREVDETFPSPSPSGRHGVTSPKIMGDDQFKTKLKRVLDMTVFSQLLEMDYEENRKTSSKALYGFIERADKIVEDMEHAL
ncbi:hypothetical protein N7448_008632 [Penicillium atrosanguineum]|uniref:Uncharacterized protein n=1 Tax=Penicillium atrosanguineum TaxID=1132637 RepID=A0A9W9QBG2_9EURO|nr:uncharacterized protein N7443_000345 [Penicillium atrosanguineum]KAJ5127853.1 hypothetical protein N7448_008632 [Penicillium atrosanguineum]KAJ5148060.1 hypothetical protein N7526_001412 [Penicillium atrosanguineum]KAJ5313461.1 hypothetical protein N7443_000345 [Penicillium atrosanguineum]KAJ5330644.1 hypothetical protein N7476_000427 [Penicillium atrosanguineum]